MRDITATRASGCLTAAPRRRSCSNPGAAHDCPAVGTFQGRAACAVAGGGRFGRVPALGLGGGQVLGGGPAGVRVAMTRPASGATPGWAWLLPGPGVRAGLPAAVAAQPAVPLARVCARPAWIAGPLPAVA